MQPGPPGTRAAIYGIWSDAEREEAPPSGEWRWRCVLCAALSLPPTAHPNGPFAYWRLDERRWQDIERELETPRAQARAEELREEYAARLPLADILFGHAPWL